ncbi:MAG: hypothetical protein JST00_02330 [Deltaproteobacteria bacterium]|nr:hypothetical protein [Deltaproteobacteria bacterium]
MKKLLIALLVSTPLAACNEEVIVRKVEDPNATPPPAQTTEPTEPAPQDPQTPAEPKPTSNLPEDRCLDGQDMDAADVDISKCPELPSAPEEVAIGTDGKDAYELGAWEIGTTSTGETYKYGSLSAPGTNPRVLKYDGGTAAVNEKNIECWAKGYYRLRKILQNPPAEYVALRKAKFQFRFFQFQTDLRNGPTGYKQISSFQDHLVKWVTVISRAGVCQQPTLTQFRDYAKGELTDRGLPLPKTN